MRKKMSKDWEEEVESLKMGIVGGRGLRTTNGL